MNRNSTQKDLKHAKRVLSIEATGLNKLSQSLNETLSKALDIIQSIKGRVVVTGMGKSGHVAKKIAATLASTGKPAFFIHPGEASHGDIGMISEDDVVLALTNSGETPELNDIISYTRRFNIPLVCMTGQGNSLIAVASDVSLVLPSAEEACAIGLAPTTSTTMMMAYGDVLAVVLMQRQGFSSEDFKLRHPGGRLGQSLLKVSDIMHVGDALPIAKETDLMTKVLPEMTTKNFGCIGIVNNIRNLTGIVTDGDLRRHMENGILDLTAAEVMNPKVKTIRAEALASEALQIMNNSKITGLFVLDKQKIIGLLHVHDCLRAGIA